MTNSSQKTPLPEKLNVWLPFLLSVVAALGIMIGFKLQDNLRPASKPSVFPITGKQEVGKIEEILRFVETRYVEEVDREKIVEDIINEVLQNLDPHSSYIPAEELQSINESLEGSFDGIGVQFLIINDTILVVSPVAGGPSEQLGIRAGDKIVSINDTTVAGIGITNPDIMAQLRGKKGTEVKIGIMRGHNPEIIPYNIVRDKIPDFSIDVNYMIDSETGYVKISRFSGTTYEEFMTAVEKMNKAGMKNLVIDLRQNPGGYLQAATKIAGQLFNEERLLVYTEGKTQRRNEYESTGRNFYDIDEVAVLLDEGSASASEILAGAVQDSDRGTIIGRRSFGKGLVQEQYDLSDGSALRLTVARYFTPSGRSIQKPYKDKGAGAYDNDISERMKGGELSSQDSVKLSDSTKYYTDEGRVVYGGGGIMPDIFIPLDTTLNIPYFAKSSQYILEFVYEYLDGNREQFSKYESPQQFIKEFNVSDKLLKQFTDFVAQKGVKKDRKGLKKSKTLLSNRIKAFIARDLFKSEGFYRVMNKDDKVYEKAVQVINKAVKAKTQANR